MKKILTISLAAVLLLCFFSFSCFASEDIQIRVGLFYGSTAKASVTLNSTSFFVLPNGQTPYFSVTAAKDAEGKMNVSDSEGTVICSFEKNVPCVFETPENVIAIGGSEYRGKIELTAVSSGIRVVEIISLEDYVRGVLPNEAVPSWSEETLKAFAVAARSFTMANMGDKHKSDGFDICTTTHCQTYKGMSSELPSTNRAVELTENQTVTYNGEPISAMYSTDNGGYCEACENVWTAKLPYFVSKPDPYNPVGKFDWEVTYTAEELRQTVLSKGKDIGKVKSVKIDSKADSGRVLKLTVVGEKGEYSSTKDSIRSLLNLKSTLFEMSGNGDFMQSLVSAVIANENSVEYGAFVLHSVNTGGSEYVFKGKGFGHGVGMSAWGAEAMGRQGFSYRDILGFYYENTVIKELN